MATFNAEQFLTQKLNSFGNQTSINWHLILSDNGSSGVTLVVKKMDLFNNQMLENSIKYINKNVSESLNYLIKIVI